MAQEVVLVSAVVGQDSRDSAAEECDCGCECCDPIGVGLGVIFLLVASVRRYVAGLS